MNYLQLAIALLLSYLLGSIPSAVWIGKYFHKTDVREHGSGNPGATNVIRVLGWKTGIPVLLIDLAKGWLATMLPVFFRLTDQDSALLIDLQLAAAVLAVTGHIFPVFAGFRGGKGVATIFGALLALHPFLTICSLGVFLAALLITGIVSVSSISAGVAFPLFLFFMFGSPSVVFSIFSVVVAIALVFTHRKNIARLFRGEEPKFIKFRRKTA